MNWIPNWILKLFGKNIAIKLQLEDGKMEGKDWYKSKTLWAAVVAGLIGIYGGISQVHPLPAIPQWVLTLLGAMGLWGLRTADTKII